MNFNKGKKDYFGWGGYIRNVICRGSYRCGYQKDMRQAAFYDTRNNYAEKDLMEMGFIYIGTGIKVEFFYTFTNVIKHKRI